MVTNPFAKILEWLRAGYPQGIPQSDYVALFGILHRDLTDEEVATIAHELQTGPAGLDDRITREEIAEQIRRAALQTASDEDIQRVAGHLAAGGWPLVPANEAVHEPHNVRAEAH